MPTSRMFAVVYLLPFILLVAQFAPPTQIGLEPTAVASSEISSDEDALQAGATTTRDNVGIILGNLLILSLYSFPMSIGEGWVLSDLKKAKKRPRKELPEPIDTPGNPALTIDNQAPASIDDRTTLVEHLSLWVKNLPRVTTGFVAGGLLMVVVVVIGAVAFALYYVYSGQPEKVSEIIPRFVYWFPFALLGLVTNVPFTFSTFDWAVKRQRVVLRLIVWWTPRLVIVAFMFNLPFLQDLDPATTALVVFAIDCVLAAFFLWLHMSRKQIGMREIQQDYDT